MVNMPSVGKRTENKAEDIHVQGNSVCSIKEFKIHCTRHAEL